MRASPTGPSAARICDSARELEGLDIRWSLKDIDVQASAHMPRNTGLISFCLHTNLERKHTGNGMATQPGYPVSTV